MTVLDLDRPSGTEGVSVQIPTDARSRFRPRIEDAYFSKNVCATGPVEKLRSRYVVTVETPDALILTAGQLVEPLFAPNAVSGCEHGVELPKPTRRQQPRYTADALAAGIQGSVRVEAVVRTNGRVGETRVQRSLEKGLDQEAVLAAKEWRFVPGTQEGQPVPIIVWLELSFTIRSR
jgi:protein TonB